MNREGYLISLLGEAGHKCARSKFAMHNPMKGVVIAG